VIPLAAGNPAPISLRVEIGEGQRRRRKRSRGRRAREQRLAAEIQRKAQDRQRAWLETGQPFVTGRLTLVLDNLSGEVRHERSEESA
jgi:hypothetical protein